MNKNWARWIFASVTKHFDDNKQGLATYVEGTYRDTRTEVDFFEVRQDGPYSTEVSKDYWHFFIEVNILIQSTMSATDFHKIYRDVGIVMAAFTDIPVYRYGTGDDDDDTLLGCLQLVSDAQGKKPVKVSHFGQIEPRTDLLQATVEGHYFMFLKEA